MSSANIQFKALFVGIVIGAIAGIAGYIFLLGRIEPIPAPALP